MVLSITCKLPTRLIPLTWSVFLLHAVLIIPSAVSQTEDPKEQVSSFAGRPDTLQTLPSDSFHVIHPIAELGSIEQTTEVAGILASRQIPWFSYDYLGDLLWGFPGVYIRDLGSPGQYHQVNLRGVDSRGIQFLIDGRRMNDPLTGTYHLNFVSPEFIEHVEIVSGSTAAMHEFNGTGGVVNVVSTFYDTVRPITKVRYSEGTFGHLYADGVFTQNVAPRVNLVAGFQRWNLDGRFPNSSYDAWNIRIKARWNPSNRFNLMVSEQYNNHQAGMNGGIDFTNTEEQDVFNELFATLRNTDSFEKINRHDLTASVGLRLFPDSASVTAVTLFYTSLFREYRDEENRISSNGIFIRSDHRSSFAGVSIRQKLNARPFLLQIGANIERLQVEGSPNVGRRDEPLRGTFGNLQFHESRLGLIAFARYDRYLDRNLSAHGISANLELFDWVTVRGGFSRSERAPTLQEQFWDDSTVSRIRKLEPERHTLAQAGLDLQFRKFLSLEATYSWRKIEDPIVIRSVPGTYVFPSIDIRNEAERVLQTIDGKFSFGVWKITLEGRSTYLVQKDAGRRVRLLPRWYLIGGVYFRDKILRGFLDLKAGLRGRYIGRQVGSEFNPETLIYSERSGSELGPYQTLDVIFIGHVRRAYIHLIWENITDEEYMLTPGYPMLGTNVRFGINWTLLD